MVKVAMMIGLLSILALYGCTKDSEKLLESFPNPAKLLKIQGKHLFD